MSPHGELLRGLARVSVASRVLSRVHCSLRVMLSVQLPDKLLANIMRDSCVLHKDGALVHGYKDQDLDA